MQDGVVSHTQQDVAQATNEAFVDNTTLRQPVVKNTMGQENADADKGIVKKEEKIADSPAAEIKVEEKIQDAPKVPNFQDLSDEDFEKELAKRTKGAVKTLGELRPENKPTKGDIEKEELALKNAALEWKLSTGAISRADYEAAILEKTKTNRDIALQVYTAEMLEIDPKMSADEIEESFKDYYLEDESDESSPKRKLRLKEMNKTAEQYRAEKTGFLDQIDPEYKSYRKTEADRKIMASKIDTVFEAFPETQKVTTKYTGPDNKEVDLEVSYTIDDADFKAMKKEVRANMLDLITKLGADPAQIEDAHINKEMDQVLKGRIHDKMLAHVAQASANKARMDAEVYYKNIPVRQGNFTTMTTDTQQNNGKTRVFNAEERAAMHGKRN